MCRNLLLRKVKTFKTHWSISGFHFNRKTSQKSFRFKTKKTITRVRSKIHKVPFLVENILCDLVCCVMKGKAFVILNYLIVNKSHKMMPNLHFQVVQFLGPQADWKSVLAKRILDSGGSAGVKAASEILTRFRLSDCRRAQIIPAEERLHMWQVWKIHRLNS